MAMVLQVGYLLLGTTMYHARPYDRTQYTVPVLRATIHHIRCTYEIYVLRTTIG
jgi:hypothetical protein